jgi:hypothetical protein
MLCTHMVDRLANELQRLNLTPIRLLMAARIVDRAQGLNAWPGLPTPLNLSKNRGLLLPSSEGLMESVMEALLDQQVRSPTNLTLGNLVSPTELLPQSVPCCCPRPLRDTGVTAPKSDVAEQSDAPSE